MMTLRGIGATTDDMTLRGSFATTDDMTLRGIGALLIQLMI